MSETEETLELYEIKNRLKQIRSEFYGFGNFTIHTMSRVEKRAREVKTFSLQILGEEDEVTMEMESAIVISKEYHRKHLGLENEIIRDALRHLEYGIDLFLEKI